MMVKSSLSLRPLKIQSRALAHAEGSCLITMGRTQVLCVATVEDSIPAHAEEKGIGWITAEYAMLPRAGEKRAARVKMATGGRAQEISRLVGRSLRAAVDLRKLEPQSLVVDCDVLCADGGTRTASVNGGFVALVEALLYLRKRGLLDLWPLREFVGAVSVGIFKGKPFLDMSYAEDKEAEADVNVVMTESGKIVEVQGTAETKLFSTKDLSRMVALAYKGIRQVIQKQKKALGKLPYDG